MSRAMPQLRSFGWGGDGLAGRSNGRRGSLSARILTTHSPRFSFGTPT